MIAFVSEGQIGAGVVLEPATDRLTYARHGGGCWRSDGEQAPGPAASARLLTWLRRP